MENRTQRWGPVPPCVAMDRSQPCLTLGFCEIGTLLIFGLWSPSVGWDGTSEPSSSPLSPGKPAATLDRFHAGALIMTH